MAKDLKSWPKSKKKQTKNICTRTTNFQEHQKTALVKFNSKFIISNIRLINWLIPNEISLNVKKAEMIILTPNKNEFEDELIRLHLDQS